MKVFLSIIAGIGIFILLWYFGFLDFIGIRGAGCNDNTWMAVQKDSRYKYGKCVESIDKTTPTTVKSCQQEYQEAEDTWAKSKKACILTVGTLICPRDKNFTAEVNPCVGKILEDKGWKYPNVALPPTPNVDEIEVTNPNGAILYYQSDTKSGGKMYSASNVSVPVGTKMTIVRFWQTNLLTQPLAGYYETTHQPYANKNGFFDLKDVKKL